MGEMIDSFTKRKTPNAYVLFTTQFISDYKATHSNGNQRFAGGIPRAINDPLVVNAWSALSDEERQVWKNRAREMKQRHITEYAYHVEQYVSIVSAARETSENTLPVTEPERSEREPLGKGTTNGGENTSQGSFGESSGTHLLSESLRAHSTSLRRLLRPQKKRKNLEENKYAPAFFEEISTAKQFEEKRRRERECVMSIWTWRFADNKNGLLNEPFFLISSQTAGVDGDVHIPGSIACIEFSIRDGVKREFACSFREGFSDWTTGSRVRSGRSDCCQPRSSLEICREIFGEWLHSTRRDLSSKTPVFYCLVNEFSETFDCLSHVYAYKDGTPTRFSPYLLATIDDLVLSYLQFFDVAVTSDGDLASSTSNEQQQPLRLSHETFSLSRVIDQNYDDLAESHACESHRKYSQGSNVSSCGSPLSQEGAVGGGDAFAMEKNQRCPLAIVRICAEYAKYWIENGQLDGRILSNPLPKGKRHESKKSEKEMPSGAESLKSEEFDRFSYLALSASGSWVSDRTLHETGSDHGARGGRRSETANLENLSEDSGDVVEINSEETIPEPENGIVSAMDGGLAGVETTMQREPTRPRPLSTGPQSSSASYTAREAAVLSRSCASSHGLGFESLPLENSSKYHATVPQYVDVPNAAFAQDTPFATIGAVTGPRPSMPAAVCPHMWTEEFLYMYEAQLRLKHGCRGLGRGVRFSSSGTADPFDY